MSPVLAVGLGSPGLCTATGLGVESLWEALRIGRHTSTPNEFRHGPWSDLTETFTVPDPDAATLGVHRKVLRTMVKQTRLAMYGAQLALSGIPDVGGPSWGLYLGLPSVFEALVQKAPGDQLDEFASDSAKVAELYVREMSPFFVLQALNSTTAGHIAILVGLNGPTAVYSPFDDAGLQALVDGALAVAEGDCDAAVIGAVGSGTSPWLVLQDQEFDRKRATAPGESAVFFVAGRAGDVVLSGYGRGFGVGSVHSHVIARVLREALRMADLSAQDVGWALTGSSWSDEVDKAQHDAISEVFGDGVPVFSAERAIGMTGPAHPLVYVLLARHALQQT